MRRCGAPARWNSTSAARATSDTRSTSAWSIPTRIPSSTSWSIARSGHCGYFASALTLLLRSIGIPARMVNGFKGGDWNEIAQVLNVRQKHAHSWVEVYVRPGPDQNPVWVTLDPTPAGERNEAVASVGGFPRNFRLVTDLVRYIWVFYIVGYNADRQQFLLYEPIRKLIEEARSGFQMMGQAIQSTATAVFGFRDFAAFISVRGFFVSFFRLAQPGRPGPRHALALVARAALVSRRPGGLGVALGQSGLVSPPDPVARRIRPGTARRPRPSTSSPAGPARS